VADVEAASEPIVLLNTAGFYDAMLGFLEVCVREGMLTEKNRRIVQVASTVDEALDLLGVL
jgi:predicted Rossmann-fold nucleotide-binding protein